MGFRVHFPMVRSEWSNDLYVSHYSTPVLVFIPSLFVPRDRASIISGMSLKTPASAIRLMKGIPHGFSTP